MTDQIEQFRKDGPTERQVRDWFQLSTINHHIQEDGSHISARAMYIAQSAWDAAKQSAPVVKLPPKVDVCGCGEFYPAYETNDALDAAGVKYELNED